MKLHIIAASIAVAGFSSVLHSKTPALCSGGEVGVSQANFGSYVSATSDKNYFLRPGQCLVSPNRRWMSVMQATDGNFVLYSLENEEAKTARWSTRTGGNPGAGLLVQQDGHFVVYKAGGITDASPWTSATGGSLPIQ